MIWLKSVVLFFSMIAFGFATETKVLYLSGTGYKHTVDWEFMVTGGQRSGTWTTIPVPSCWELEGFGSYNYGTDRPQAGEEGKYRYRFRVPESWSDKQIDIVFDGSMTDTRVWINGKSAGPKHQGAFYRFRYDITSLVRTDAENLLEVTVSKKSSNSSVNRAERQADYWIFGGIFRPVWLEAHPVEHIVRVAIDAKANGVFTIQAFLANTESAQKVQCQIKTTTGENVGSPFSASVRPGQERVTLRTRVEQPRLWTPETPNLYDVEVALKNTQVIHKMSQKFGFRTIEVKKGDGIYVNGVKVCLKGVNRHSFWPESGRTMNKSLCVNDVNHIKDMNMNAVRMSHYPPDADFLDACDSLGLFVLDELAGWQSAYDTETGERLVKELVIRDVNHPSIIFWNNGNEGGWNEKLDDDFAIWDPQKRLVLHPWSISGGINTSHYQNFEKYRKLCEGPNILLPTEIWHGLYDGGHGAGLEDYWEMIQDKPLAAGCFLWSYADEGVVRTDKNGILDVDGNHAPDGILGPYHEKEGSYYSIKETFSPVHFICELLPDPYNGHLQVENRFFYTDFSDCSFTAWLERLPGPFDADNNERQKKQLDVKAVSCAPGDCTRIQMEVPENFHSYDILSVQAYDPFHRHIITKTYSITTPEAYCRRVVKTGSENIQISEGETQIIVSSPRFEYRFHRKRGTLSAARRDGETYAFRNGPRLLAGSERGAKVSYAKDGNVCTIECKFDTGSFTFLKWTVFPSGWLKLEYSYRLYGYHDFFGISFSYPEENVRGIRWLGDGPYHVWKNRTKGVLRNVWNKSYNNTMPGESWNYPAFKGYHSGFTWMVLQTREGAITVMTPTDNLYLQVYRANIGKSPLHATSFMPSADIAFLHGISPIGTKFRSAVNTGSGGRQHHNAGEYQGILYFYFESSE